METLTKSVRLSPQQRMQKFDTWVITLGYRAPHPEDLVPGAEFLAVDVDRYMDLWQGVSFSSIGSARIKLDEKPVDKRGDTTVVLYHQTFPSWKDQCFVPVEQFCATGFKRGSYMNDTRFVLKK